MSTMIASDKTISAIVRYAMIHEITIETANSWAPMAPEFGQAMLQTNALAFNTCYAHWANYTDEQKAMGYVLADVDNIKFQFSEVEPAHLEPAQIAKLCDFYDYQACEIEGYRDTLIARTIAKIREYAITQIDGYTAQEPGPLSEYTISRLLGYINRNQVHLYHDYSRFGDYCFEGLDLIGQTILTAQGTPNDEFTHSLFCGTLEPMQIVERCNQWFTYTGQQPTHYGNPAQSCVTGLRAYALDRVPAYNAAEWGI